MTEENHEKTPVRLVDTGIRTQDIPNASLVRYHGATSLGSDVLLGFECTINLQNLIKIDGAILEKIKFFNFFLM